MHETHLRKRSVASPNSAPSHRLLAYVSHDLRQLVHTLRLFSGTLASTVPAGSHSAQVLARQEATLDTMGDLLDSLSDLCALGDRALAPTFADFRLRRILRRLRAEFELEAASRNLLLTIDDSDCIVRSDPRLLERMLRNLLANAVRYTLSGKIRLVSFRRGSTVRIEVHDTGVGIPPDQLRAIFDDYYQGHSAARAASSGTGLGLAIVRRFADALRHPLEVRSRLGEGTCFELTLPAASTALR